MIGKLKTVVLDAADLTGLADFYAALAGWTRTDVEDDWITMVTPDGWRVAVQLAPDHVPPRWPDPAHPQQFHLDLRVADIDAEARRAEGLGATRLGGGGGSWHTLMDPAGHPFDLCRGDDPATSIYAVTIDCPDAKVLSHLRGGARDGDPVRGRRRFADRGRGQAGDVSERGGLQGAPLARPGAPAAGTPRCSGGLPRDQPRWRSGSWQSARPGFPARGRTGGSRRPGRAPLLSHGLTAQVTHRRPRGRRATRRRRGR